MSRGQLRIHLGAAPGVGLGLAPARGLSEAMNGTLIPEATPGGGLTMVLSLPVAGPGEDVPAAMAGEGTTV